MSVIDSGTEREKGSSAVAQAVLSLETERFLDSVEVEDEDRAAVFESFGALHEALSRPGGPSDTPPNIIRMSVWR